MRDEGSHVGIFVRVDEAEAGGFVKTRLGRPEAGTDHDPAQREAERTIVVDAFCDGFLIRIPTKGPKRFPTHAEHFFFWAKPAVACVEARLAVLAVDLVWGAEEI